MDQRIVGVLSLHKRNRDRVVLLPDEGFHERIAQGRLYAAIDSETQVVGYVLFDTPRQHVKIIHLVVDEDLRGSGVARQLIERVALDHPERTHISVRCRNDYPAHGLWGRVGFVAHAESAGRSRDGHLLTTWRRRLGHPGLFDDLPPDGFIVALDHVVFEDLVWARPQGIASRCLLDDWVRDEAELALTEETLHEIQKWTDPTGRARLHTSRDRFGMLDPREENWRPLLEEVGRLVPGAGPSDRRHLARAVAAGADFFATRDDAVLASAAAFERQFGLVIATPTDIISRLDRRRSQASYEPASLAGTQVQLSPATTPERDVVSSIQMHSMGERRHDARELVRAVRAAARAGQLDHLWDHAGQREGTVGVILHPEHLEVAILRTRLTGRRGEALARQVIAQQRAAALDSGVLEVRVTEPCLTPGVVRALLGEDFIEREGRWTVSVRPGIRSGSFGAAEAGVIERREWPAKVLGSGIPTYLISIDPDWAGSLIDPRLTEAELFARPRELGLAREHVYFRSAANGKQIAAPARLIWWVKGNRRRSGSVRAVSLVAEAALTTPKDAFRRFERLGALEWSQITDWEAVQAIRFTHTELLKPISLEEARALFRRSGWTFRAPQSPYSLSDSQFETLYRAGALYAN